MPDRRLERIYLEQLRPLVPELAKGTVNQGESPDFTVVDGDRVIGIELTEFHLAPLEGERPHREVITLRWRVTRLAETLHRERGGPGLYLTADFARSAPESKRHIAAIADQLADAVLSADVPKSIEAGPRHLDYRLLPAGLQHVWFSASIDGEDSLWKPTDSGWVAGIPADQIAALIAKKARRAVAYRSACTDLWLVIVHNVWPSAPAELRADARAALYDSPFDRVVWFDPQSSAVYTLNGLAA